MNAFDTEVFSRLHRIRFSECDPAGIVFYPQYFVMFNNLLESWIDALLPDLGFSGLIAERRVGLPTVHMDAEFHAISRMGDDVSLSLEVTHLGQKSLTLELTCSGADGVVRMRAAQVLVTTSLESHRSIAIPDNLRQALSAGISEESAP